MALSLLTSIPATCYTSQLQEIVLSTSAASVTLTALTAPLAHGISPLWAKLKRSGLLRFQIKNFRESFLFGRRSSDGFNGHSPFCANRLLRQIPLAEAGAHCPAQSAHHA